MEFAPGSQFSLTATQAVTPEIMDQVSAELAALGLSLEPKLSPQQILERHIAGSLPRNRESFIAKEHFLHFGSQAGIKRTAAGLVFNGLAITMLRKPELRGILKREEAELPPLPAAAGLQIDSVPGKRAQRHLTDLGIWDYSPIAYAVRIGAIETYAANADPTDLNPPVLGERSVNNLRVISRCLIEQIQ